MSTAAENPPDTERLSLHEIAAHIATADNSRIMCDHTEKLRQMLNSPADILSELRRFVTRKGSAVTQKMDRCIALVAQSAQSMRIACERVMRSGRSTAVEPVTTGAPGLDAAALLGTRKAPAAAAAMPQSPLLAVNGSVAAGDVDMVAAVSPDLAQGESGLFCLCQQVYHSLHFSCSWCRHTAKKELYLLVLLVVVRYVFSLCVKKHKISGT